MIPPAEFHSALEAAGVGYVAGVPDSLLKDYCAYAAAALPRACHLIAANEGSAVAAAAGFHLATGGVGLVYMQNSGLGHAVNPLLSLVDPAVYSIPVVLLVGWRGEPGVADEPQHRTQGRLTPALLDTLEIPWFGIDGAPEAAVEAARKAVQAAKARGGPAALLVRKGAFAPFAGAEGADSTQAPEALSREDAIACIAAALPPEAVVVSTTGKISRELYEVRRRAGGDGAQDFLTVGSMGHASQIAAGIAAGRPEWPVVCLDGDGAAIMHMGHLATLGATGPANLCHVVLNNGAHESVGGQPTVGFQVDLAGIARACGYRRVDGPLHAAGEIADAVRDSVAAGEPSFLEVRVAPGARSDLGRPREAPVDNKAALTRRLWATPAGRE